jgi:hypothetical protein
MDQHHMTVWQHQRSQLDLPRAAHEGHMRQQRIDAARAARPPKAGGLARVLASLAHPFAHGSPQMARQ